MVYFILGDMLTGRRIQTVPVVSGSWSDTLNGQGEVTVTVSMRDPDVKKLGITQSALPAKAFLAAVEGDTILQAGPILSHEWEVASSKLILRAGGLWSYFDRRVLLPVLAGRLPSDPTTDTNFRAVSIDPNDPWPTDTRSSLQGIAVSIVAQALSWPSGNVPVILPAVIPGDSVRRYRGAEMAPVGQRLRELTQVEDGPDIQFLPRWTVDRLGIEWVMRVGTPTQPLIFSDVNPVFNVGVAKSSVSKFRVQVNGSNIGSYGFAGGGRVSDATLTTVSYDPNLIAAGFPQFDLIDTAHSTVELAATLQKYSDELVMRGRKPIQTWSFTHQLSVHPFLAGFNVGDFAKVRIVDDPYIADGEYRLRITQRSGDAKGDTVDLTFQPEVI